MTTDAIPVRVSRKVFNPAYLPHLENFARVQIFFGGSSSGKSVFLAQRAIWDVLKGGRNYLICRAVAKTIKKSVFQEVRKVIKAWGMVAEFGINETDLTITCNNGYQILFAGLDDVEKLKSITSAKGVITDIWIEEATETNKDDVKQLVKRQRGGDEKTPKRITLSFNPIIRQHWIFAEYFASLGWADEQKEYTSENLTILKTTYKDNSFLTAQDVAGLESETDSYFYNVYTLGNWGVLGNVIFTNWKIADLSDPNSEYYLPEEQRTNLRNGGDFGFSSDPAAIHRSHYDRTHKRIYIFGELYETGLTNDVLAERTKGIVGNERIVWDSQEPKSIAELRRYGVDAVGARKGKDSVVHGIQWLQQQTIIVDKSCVNTQNELQTYKWKEDAGGFVVKSGGLPVPVDKHNHLIDAARYAYEDDALDIGEMESVENPFYG